MATIKKNHVVKKRNVLNEIRANGMNLQELRFFSIYLSKINPNDISTRTVRFSISDFQKIMELGRINTDYLKQVTNSLLCKVVNVPNERGGYVGFQLFKECTVDTDEYGEWYVEIDAHDKALPLMFEFKEKYFSYQLWNALRLKSSNQLRMYEILKQYERIGERVLPIEELRCLLGVEKNEYKRFGDFKIRVLDACQQSIEQNTDIKFTYEPYGKRGKGGKIQFLKFAIMKNENHVDKLSLSEFIDMKKEEPIILGEGEVIEEEAVATRTPEPEPPIEENPLAKLSFIEESLLEIEAERILKVANNDIDLIRKRYETIKKEKNPKNLVGYLIWGISQPEESFREVKPEVRQEVRQEVKHRPRNRFDNFKGRDIDFEALNRREHELLIEEFGDFLRDETPTAEY